jgi:MFS family permease
MAQPLGWAAYSDAFYTRRNVYLASFIMYIAGTIICAVSKNIWLLLVMRSVQACSASAVLWYASLIAFILIDYSNPYFYDCSDVFHSLGRFDICIKYKYK